MGKQEKMYEAMLQQLQGWIQRATQPSQYEQQQQADYSNLKSWLGGKDFRDPSSVGIDLLPLDTYHKQRNQLRGQNTNRRTDSLENRQQDLADNQFDSNYANQYQNQVAGLEGRQLGQLSSLQNLHSGRMGAGLQGFQQGLNGIANQPSGFDWTSLIGPAAGLVNGIRNRQGRSSTIGHEANHGGWI